MCSGHAPVNCLGDGQNLVRLAVGSKTVSEFGISLSQHVKTTSAEGAEDVNACGKQRAYKESWPSTGPEEGWALPGFSLGPRHTTNHDKQLSKCHTGSSVAWETQDPAVRSSPGCDKYATEKPITIRLSATLFNITVIEAFAPTSDYSEEDIEEFYNQVENTIEKAPKTDIIIIKGDWTAKEDVETLTAKLSSATTEAAIAILDKAGHFLTEEKEMWTEYFSKLYNHPDQADSEILVGTSLGKEDYFPILCEEVEAAIRSLKNRKAPGIDNVPTELTKEGGSITIDMLMKICNNIWQAGQWPSTWTQSLIITLPKKGTLQHCQNYCTISLFSHPSKVMLKILLNRLKRQAENIIAEEQEGFREGRTTVEQIFNLLLFCEKYQQHQIHLYYVFIDFEKAFDRVWHSALWNTMRRFNRQKACCHQFKYLGAMISDEGSKLEIMARIDNSTLPDYRTYGGTRTSPPIKAQTYAYACSGYLHHSAPSTLPGPSSRPPPTTDHLGGVFKPHLLKTLWESNPINEAI
ncbi:unnamed protein product [Leuciscus chuanchicus]